MYPMEIQRGDARALKFVARYPRDSYVYEFETAFLIAKGCLEFDGTFVQLTKLGRQVLKSAYPNLNLSTWCTNASVSAAIAGRIPRCGGRRD